MTQRDIARVCHEVNKAYCDSINDFSQHNWNSSPDWQKESAEKGVKFRIENPDAPVSAQHDAWLADKEKDGWKYGEVKDAEKKEHPCMVPYDQLPASQKTKDYLFIAVVDTMKGMIDK